MTPKRADKVGMQVFLEPETREQFKELAKDLGIPAQELARHLIENAVIQGTDPTIKAAISAEKQRLDAARANVLATITPSKFTPS